MISSNVSARISGEPIVLVVGSTVIRNMDPVRLSDERVRPIPDRRSGVDQTPTDPLHLVQQHISTTTTQMDTAKDQHLPGGFRRGPDGQLPYSSNHGDELVMSWRFSVIGAQVRESGCRRDFVPLRMVCIITAQLACT
jgi:hypothetical protein